MPNDEEALPPILAFTQLTLPTSLRSCFAGFSAPTPIQACTWPPALLGRDVVGIAETGSGKTLAFGIPALARLVSAPPKSGGGSTVSVLVVAPTRELALQTHDTLSALGAPLGIASVAVFGGVPKEPQVRMLRNMSAGKGKGGTTTRVVVGTPGRILDLVQEGVCDLSGVNYLVLDEADRMLDKGFENDIRNIISHTKQGAERQTMMFSATWPDAVRRLASTFQQNPVRVTVGSDDLTANSRVEQVVEVFDDTRSKDSRLLGHLRTLAHKKTTTTGAAEARILVFALYKKEASRVEQMLRQKGYSVGALHGDMSQTARMEALDRFKNGTTGLLVATDVAARGLDIPNVGAVINYTFPLTIEDYIHRIGRTGRGGKSGKSITFFTGENHERSLAGELARVLRESGFECEGLKKFPMTIKKKEHSAYGAFFRDDIPMPKGPTKIVFD
ncbi:P-loop containing nucleoside triphosphate hydrolase protein [Mycena sp. CBHHK59/15]|nr:P-loop containing nucleoside triphosphate hydrolase protein [Mycena sp. CBHHK59/15]